MNDLIVGAIFFLYVVEGEPRLPIENPMTYIEQHRIILELKDYIHKMKRHDLEEFEMFLKRDKDDEDLDEASQKRLLQLYTLYLPVHKRLLP